MSNNSEWEVPYFAQPKPKTNRVRFLSNFINLIKQLKRKLYSMTNINEMLLKQEGLQYDTLLNLNMGYSYIRLSKGASNFCTTIPPWGEYCYKCLLTGIENSPGISNRISMI